MQELAVVSDQDGGGRVNVSVTADGSTKPINGTCQLRVNDNCTNDTGYISSRNIRV